MKAMCPGYITTKILATLEESCPSTKLPQSYCADNREEGRFVFMITHTHTQIYYYYLLLLFISLVTLLTVQFIFQLLFHGNYYLYYCYYYYFYLNLLSLLSLLLMDYHYYHYY